ncbi:putative disease resistance RPP13-like protein 1 [Morella rubra]|uniref:Putative disease resistance RPP13-like protein 1 n=1 Tax=Morella rubra TaxID=262757 RepID=A0A6A1UXX4_9ROSI|nr:putative disease resistance RPP13-like protein 1 [Morella rubra]
MAVGELFAAALIQVLLERLVSRELLNFAHREGLRRKLEKLKNTLSIIQAVVDDAEEKQHTDKAVKKWLDDLIDLAYDAEDLLDEFTTEALRRKIMGENRADSSKVQNLIPACVTGLNPSALSSNVRLGSKIKEITARFNDIAKQKCDLNLRENVGGRSNRIRGTLPPTSLVNEAEVYGREKEKASILELLLSEKYIDAAVSVLPIHGMTGVGKTTLAQLLYNDHKLKSFFDLKAWACVSKDFDAVRVTKTILNSLIFEKCDDSDLNSLQVELKAKLNGKKFLVILDDVWFENYHDWTILRAPFEAGAPGSRIVVTTRNQGVSSMMGTIPAFHLQVLSDDVCLSIFTQHALGERDFSAHPNLADIGVDIVKRCKGLPLVAKTLGGLLRTKMGRDEWEDVLNSKVWDISPEKSGIVPALMLSYHHLPSYLKRCFAYCSIFPKDYEFEEKQLILLWMAEGLIQPQEKEKQMEELDGEYFRNLLSLSFFQQSSNDKSRFLMHDLINDLAQWVARDICFRMEDRIEGCKPSKRARHSSYLGSEYDGTKKFEIFSELTCLRTFLPLMQPMHCYLTYFVPLKLLPKLRCLRVLSFRGYCITELPDSIGDLKHLRYLDLSYTSIKSMPESTTTLCNLQTLRLDSCYDLKKFPSKFGNLVNLRHLNIEGTLMPPQIGKLTCLRTLSNLVVRKDSWSRIKELGPLVHLRGTICISRLENIIEPRVARDANLIGKPNLSGLLLEWSSNFDESQDRTTDFEVLNLMRPHKVLKELTISGYYGTKFPTSLNGPSLPNMVFLRIEMCKNCCSLPPLGQLPSLKVLFISRMARIKNVGLEFDGEGYLQPFRSLETLCFEGMQDWENWIPCEEFPRLQELSIRWCPKLLGKLPNHLPLLEKAVIKGCGQLIISLSSFPELCELEIDESKGVVCRSKVDFSSLNLENLSTISKFTCQIEGLDMQGLTRAENLTIENCKELTPLWSNDVGLLQYLPYLRVLKISDCPRLVSLVAEEVGEELQLGLPSKLREIQIRHCHLLKSLPKTMMCDNNFLTSILIHCCDSLMHFATDQLPQTLKELKIVKCKNLLILLQEDDINNSNSGTSFLECLEIHDCPSLRSLTSSGELPATLKHLRISFCQKLESMAKRFHLDCSLEYFSISHCESLKSLPMGLHSLSHLDKMEIWICPALIVFPDEDLLPVNLRVLQIFGCKNLRVLPNCIHDLTSLQELDIRRCPGIVSFPEEGFPTNLTSLEICDLNINDALFEWGLHRLTSLKTLSIRGGCQHVVSFPEMMLPASLTSLNIERFPNLKYMSSKGFRMLTSLEELYVSACENLMSFPEDGLPLSLLKLRIQKCPPLKEHCKKDQGRDWLKIAHIPCIYLDNKFIFETGEES